MTSNNTKDPAQNSKIQEIVDIISGLVDRLSDEKSSTLPPTQDNHQNNSTRANGDDSNGSRGANTENADKSDNSSKDQSNNISNNGNKNDKPSQKSNRQELLQLRGDLTYMQDRLNKLKKFEDDFIPSIKGLKRILERISSAPDDEIRTLRKVCLNLKSKIPLTHNTASTDFDGQLNQRKHGSKDIPSLCVKDILINENDFFKELRKTYDGLSIRSQLCLLCFAVFPENAVIKKRTLLYWWIGERLLEQLSDEDKNKKAEEIAEEILLDFEAKKFVHPVHKRHRKVPKSYKMYPIVRSAVIMLAREAKFFDYDSEGIPTLNFQNCNRACLVYADEGSNQERLESVNGGNQEKASNQAKVPSQEEGSNQDRVAKEEKASKHGEVPKEDKISTQDEAPKEDKVSKQDEGPKEDLVSEQDEGPKGNIVSEQNEGPKQDIVPKQDEGPKEDIILEQDEGPKEDIILEQDEGPTEDIVPKQDEGPKQDMVPKQAEGPKQDKVSKQAEGPKQDTVSKQAEGPKQDKVSKQAEGPKQDTFSKQAEGPKQDKVPKQEVIRTLFNVGEEFPDFKYDWFSKMKRIRVLYLGRWQSSDDQTHIEVESTKYLEGLKNMRDLRLLSLQGISGIKELPSSISSLRSLRILDLRACYNLEKLTKEIGSLKKLTHLDISECFLLDGMPVELCSLSELEVFKGFVISDPKKRIGHQCTLKSLGKLKNLRKLSVSINSGNFQTEELSIISGFQKLEELRVEWGGEHSQNKEIKNSGGEMKTTKKPETGPRKIILTRSYAQRKPKQFESLQKLDLLCFPDEKLPRWLKPADLQSLEKLYIRGGRLKSLRLQREETLPPDQVVDEEWRRVEVLRLKFLNELKSDWKELRKLFPELKCLEKFKCPKVTLCPCDGTGIWEKS